MQSRPVLSTRLHLTELGFGAASLGNLYHETSDDDAEGALQAAWAGGIRYFDTAPHYGLGLSEKRLGGFLARMPRDEFVLSTKVGRLLVENENPTGLDSEGFAVPDTHRRVWDFSRDGILRSVEASLNRLGLDRIDILLAHDPDGAYAGAGVQAVETLSELRAEGVVSAIGVGTNSTDEAAFLLAETAIDVVMLAGRYTLLEQGSLESILDAAYETSRSVIAVGVFNSGLLAQPRPPANAKYNYQDAPAELIERANRIADVCERHGVTLPEAAIAFPLAHPAVASVALGMRNGDQVTRNLSLYGTPVPAAVWTDLADAGLIYPGATPRIA
jgi:D-threo-aldose 1-dehydrogenase